MARLFVAVVFLLFTISVARSPLSKPVNDVTVEGSDSGEAIHLRGESNHKETDTIDVETKVAVAEITPLNIVRFRPINRRFQLGSTLPSRRFHRDHKSRLNLRSDAQIPFGDDMILSSAENNNIDKVNFHSGVRQVRPEWIPLLHRHRHGYSHRRGGDEEKIAKYMAKRHHRFDHEKMKNFRKERENSMGKRIRKFLNQYLG